MVSVWCLNLTLSKEHAYTIIFCFNTAELDQTAIIVLTVQVIMLVMLVILAALITTLVVVIRIRRKRSASHKLIVSALCEKHKGELEATCHACN